MTTELHNIGEEWERKYILGSVSKPANVTVGLFHDGSVSGDTSSGDDLADGDDIGAITTEPADGNYGPQTIAFDTSGFSTAQNDSNNWLFENNSSIVFDLTNTTGIVDAYYVSLEWDQSGDGTPQEHLYWTGNLSQQRDLSNYTQITLETVALSQD